jgi:FkbM family methyltransferase
MSLTNSLTKLKSLGFEPKNILDIGAHHGNWTLQVKNIYPNAIYTLIEAIDYDELKRFENVHNLVLDENERVVNWHEMRNTGDSIYKENTAYFKNCNILKKTTTTLDITFPKKNNIFELIKIDAQGAELPILKGGEKLLEHTEVIILELPFVGRYNDGIPSFVEHIKYMDDIGYVPYDIVEFHKINEILIQVDFIFIKSNHSILSKIQNMINNLGN